VQSRVIRGSDMNDVKNTSANFEALGMLHSCSIYSLKDNHTIETLGGWTKETFKERRGRKVETMEGKTTCNENTREVHGSTRIPSHGRSRN